MLKHLDFILQVVRESSRHFKPKSDLPTSTNSSYFYIYVLKWFVWVNRCFESATYICTSRDCVFFFLWNKTCKLYETRDINATTLKTFCKYCCGIF